MTPKERLQFIIEGGSVVRYHTRPGIRPDTDAQHSHGVAMLCSLLSGTDEQGITKASVTLLMSALTHDLAEQVASDINANTKKLLCIGEGLDALEQTKLAAYGLAYQQWLTSEEHAVLRLADLMDRLAYCCRELALGNRNVLLIWRNTCRDLESFAVNGGLSIDISLRASCFYEALKEIYHEVTGPTGPSFDVFK